jgi:PadR family transcriptional regulator, regulatory protein PadR
MRPPRTTGALLKVLNTLLAAQAAGAEMYGLELAENAKVKPGTLYPILDRLEGLGWITPRWEDIDPSNEGRPKRCYYRLTGEGTHEARTILAEHAVGAPQWTI